MAPKSGNQRAKAIDYDDDDVYDDDEIYGEEEAGDGMTDEDREQMRIGTAKVKEALGSSFSVTDAQIQEALWHYYYDVGKSATYLKSGPPFPVSHCYADPPVLDKFAPKAQTQAQPAKAKSASRFDQAAGTAGSKALTNGKHTFDSSPCLRESPVHRTVTLSLEHARYHSKEQYDSYDCLPFDCISARARNFFWDTPWGNVPSDRLSTFTMQSVKPVGGLLGGSKLAALAAKRKQKQQQEDSASSAGAAEQGVEKAVALLDKLQIKEKSPTPRPTGEESRSRYPRKRSLSPEPAKPEPTEVEPAPVPKKPAFEMPVRRLKRPSMFGAVLCGLDQDPENKEESRQKRRRVEETLTEFPLPYANCRMFIEADPFSKPSPDDIVRQAQARAAGRS